MPITTEVPVSVEADDGEAFVDRDSRGAAARGTGRGTGARLRGRINASGLDLRNTWQVVIGALLLPLGVGVILLGWSGAAHGRVDQQQIPYLISGGVLGLAVVIVGCFFYWSHWLYRIYDQADLHHREAMQEQAQLMRSLLEALTSRPAESQDVRTGTGRTRRGASEARTSSNGSARNYVATPNGSNFHLPSCPIVVSRPASLRTVSADETAAMSPCRICEPLEAGDGPERHTAE